MKYKYTNVKIENDHDPLNPRNEFDNLSTFYGLLTRYLIGGKRDQIYSGEDNMVNHVQGLKQAGAVVVEFHTNAGLQFAVVEKDQIIKEYGNNGKKARASAEAVCKGEIATWEAWCNGEVYGYTITDNDGEYLDSCWGFYGYEYCKQEADNARQWHEKELAKQARQIDKRLAYIAQ